MKDENTYQMFIHVQQDYYIHTWLSNNPDKGIKNRLQLL